MSDLRLIAYTQQVLRLRTGSVDGHSANSKPILLLSIIDCISTAVIRDNRMKFEEELLRRTYKMLYEYYIGVLPNSFLPFFIRPFFHMSSEPFYELVWKKDVRPPMRSHTPSAKYLREHLAYAKLDDALWELLQDADNRAKLKQAIVDRYLTKTT